MCWVIVQETTIDVESLGAGRAQKENLKPLCFTGCRVPPMNPVISIKLLINIAPGFDDSGYQRTTFSFTSSFNITITHIDRTSPAHQRRAQTARSRLRPALPADRPERPATAIRQVGVVASGIACGCDQDNQG